MPPEVTCPACLGNKLGKQSECPFCSGTGRKTALCERCEATGSVEASTLTPEETKRLEDNNRL